MNKKELLCSKRAPQMRQNRITCTLLLLFTTFSLPVFSQKYHDALVFNLKGPVKEYREEHREWSGVLRFSQEGKIINDGYFERVYDSNGYLKEFVLDSGSSREHIVCKYDEKGRIIRKSSTELLDSWIQEYEYDNNDHLEWEFFDNSQGEKLTIKYINKHFDKFNNCTEFVKGATDFKTMEYDTVHVSISYWDTPASSTPSSTPSYTAPTTTPSSMNAQTTTSPQHSYATKPNHSYSNNRYNHRMEENRWIGLSVGYVQKQWMAKKEGETEKMGFWDDSKSVSGVQAGIRIDPVSKIGLGVGTGLFYEYYYSKSKEMPYEDEDYYGSYRGTMQEHALYVPLHLKYRLRITDKFHIFAYAGLGLDYGLYNKVELKDTADDYVGYSNDNTYESADTPDWKRFNASYEFGGGLTYKMLQINFTKSIGFVDMSSTNDYTMKQSKPLMLAVSIMF